MVWGYGLYSLGELLVSGLGLAMIARYVPARMGGFMMGAYYVAVGLSQYLGSVVANFAHIPENLNDPARVARDLHGLVQQAGIRGDSLHADRDGHVAAHEEALGKPFRCTGRATPLPAVRSEEFDTAG